MRDPGSMEIRLSARYLKLTAARPHQVNGAWLTPQRGADRPGPSLELRAAHLIGSSGGAVIACPERVVQKAHAGGHLREFADGCKRRRNPPFNGAIAGGEVAPIRAVLRITIEPRGFDPEADLHLVAPPQPRICGIWMVTRSASARMYRPASASPLRRASAAVFWRPAARPAAVALPGEACGGGAAGCTVKFSAGDLL